MLLHERIAAFRESLRLTPPEMARQTGIPESTYRRYETEDGAPKAQHLARLIEMGCDARWLMTGEGSMRNAAGRQSQTPAMSVGIDEALFKTVATLVQRLHAEAGIDLPGPALLDMQIKRYNRVARVAPELRDGALAMLEQDLVDELADARANPGQGKRAG